MYRVAKFGSIKNKSGGVITTHCDDNSSNTEVGNRVFANFNSSSQSLSTRSLLTQRNNDYMKFSWDPMQVVNIPRQQKAVCNREIEKLRGLERYFSRQTHLEAYKQSSQIDKVRASLVRLNKLRMSTGYEERNTEARAFPIYNPLTQQRIGKTPMLNDQTSRFKSGEKIDYSDKPIHTVAFDKKQTTPHNNGYTYMSANNENNRYYSKRFGRDRVFRKAKLPVVSRQVDFKFKIKARQDKDYGSFRRYHKLDNGLKTYETQLWRVNKVDNNSSDILTVADSKLTRRNVNNSLDSLTSQKKKTVRFNRK